MQAMPVLDAILAGKTVNLAVSNAESTIRVSNSELAEMVLVKSDEASEMYWTDTKDRFDPSSDFGPLRLPGSAMWIEFGVPKRGYAEGEWRDLDPINWAIALHEKPLPNGNFRITAFPYCVTPNSEYVASLEVGESMIVTPQGGLVPGTFSAAYPAGVSQSAIDEFYAEHGSRFANISHTCRIAYIAIGLMNCKNVTTTETDKGGPRRKKSRGKKFPRLTYRTINIPGYPSIPSVKGKPGGEPSVAIHRVRGHFKTFTDEKPLLGKHTGTYWWGWQVRGNAKNGTVISDYKVSA